MKYIVLFHTHCIHVKISITRTLYFPRDSKVTRKRFLGYVKLFALDIACAKKSAKNTFAWKLFLRKYQRTSVSTTNNLTKIDCTTNNLTKIDSTTNDLTKIDSTRSEKANTTERIKELLENQMTNDRAKEITNFPNDKRNNDQRCNGFSCKRNFARSQY